MIGGIVVAGLIGMGFLWSGWFVWALLLLIMGIYHPPASDDRAPLDRKRKILAGAALAVFLLTFVPVPIAPF